MSTIGLFDVDMHKYIHIPFNLELMKLSAYYKKKREIVALAPDLNPDKYTKFILRKDFNDGDFPEIINYSNLEYGGHAFTGELYKPLDLEIEKIKPDVHIYDRFNQAFCTNSTFKNIFKVMLGAQHLRLSLDGKTIWEDFPKQLFNKKTYVYFLHDYDLNKVKDAELVVQDLLKNKTGIPISIGTKFPIQINQEQDLFKWLGFQLCDRNFSIQYNGIMSDEALVEFVEKQKKTSMARQIDYIVTSSSYGENDFIENQLPKIFNQAIFCRINFVPLTLKYEDNFFIDKRWEKVIRLINMFIRNVDMDKTDERMVYRAINFESMYSFVSTFEEEGYCSGFAPKKIFSKEEARELFQLVREKNYPVFKDFYEKSKVELIGGQFVNVSERYTVGDR